MAERESRTRGCHETDRETTDVPASRQMAPTQEGGPLNFPPMLPLLPGPNTTQSRPRMDSKALAYSQAPHTWHLQPSRGLWGAHSQPGPDPGATPLGIPGCPTHPEKPLGNCFWKPPSCFTGHARDPGNCSPLHGAVTCLQPGICDLPFREQKNTASCFHGNWAF